MKHFLNVAQQMELSLSHSIIAYRFAAVSHGLELALPEKPINLLSI